MIICGVELSANDAVVCLLQLENKQFNLPDCRVRKLTLPKDHTREDLKKFQFSFAKVAIKERMTKGKFAGGAISFKLESAIQLISDIDVTLLSPTQIKSAISDNPLPISFSNTGLKVFQEAAFKVAYAVHKLK